MAIFVVCFDRLTLIDVLFDCLLHNTTIIRKDRDFDSNKKKQNE